MEKGQINILLIESEADNLSQIRNYFQGNSSVNSIEIASDTDVALLKIINQNPELVFIEFPAKGNTGVGIIKFIKSNNKEATIVFVSDSKDYAVEAIRHEVYDYLLKPIIKSELQKLLKSVLLIKQTNSLTKFDMIIKRKQENVPLRFNTHKGFVIINPADILYCKSASGFTDIHFNKDRYELVNLTLSKVKEILTPYGFVEISRSVIVNKSYIRKVLLKENTLLLSKNGEECEVKGSRDLMRDQTYV